MKGTKKWTSPELVVLTRSQPEEVVLAYCKAASTQYVGPVTEYGSCAGVPARIGCGGACSEYVLT